MGGDGLATDGTLAGGREVLHSPVLYRTGRACL